MVVPHCATVLVIDSGIGGMSIVRQMRTLSKEIDVLYIADNAYFPYGNLSHDVILSRLTCLIETVQNAHRIDAVVIGCNTATVLMIDQLRDAFPLPFVGIVPAIKTAAEISKTRKFTLLATDNTSQSQYLDDLIARFAGDCEVLKVGCPGLADIAEGKIYGEPVSQPLIEGIFQRLSETSKTHLNESDVILLGCTHYAFVLAELRKHFRDGQHVIEPSMPVAKRLMWVLGNQIASTSTANLVAKSEGKLAFQQQANRFYFTAATKTNTAFTHFLSIHGFDGVNVLAHLS